MYAILFGFIAFKDYELNCGYELGKGDMEIIDGWMG